MQDLRTRIDSIENVVHSQMAELLKRLSKLEGSQTIENDIQNETLTMAEFAKRLDKIEASQTIGNNVQNKTSAMAELAKRLDKMEASQTIENLDDTIAKLQVIRRSKKRKIADLQKELAEAQSQRDLTQTPGI